MNARWLTDLDVFNEWMNEEDYELTDADGSVSNEHIVYHFIHVDFSHLRSVPQEYYFSAASVPVWFFYNVHVTPVC